MITEHYIDIFGYKVALEMCRLLIFARESFTIDPFPDAIYRFYVEEKYSDTLMETAKVAEQLSKTREANK